MNDCQLVFDTGEEKMPRKLGIIAVLPFLATLLVGIAEAAGESKGAGGAQSPTDGWKLHVTPYLWAASIDISATVRGRTATDHIGFTDLLRKLEGVVMGRAGIEKGRWSFMVEGLYMKVGKGVDKRRSSLDVDVQMALIEFNARYRVIDIPLGSKFQYEITRDRPAFIVDLIGGFRYTWMRLDAEFTPSPPLVFLGATPVKLTQTKQWVDPLVGARVLWQFEPEWALGVEGTVGGFGIGNASDLTWNIVGGIQYQASSTHSFFLGYRALRIERSSGSGASKFKINATIHGPIMGWRITF